MDRRSFLGTAATFATPVVAGCAGGGGGGGGGDGGDEGGGLYGGGGGDGGGDGATGTTTVETTTVETTTVETTAGGASGAQARYTNYDWEQLEGAEATETTTVTMRNTAFHPLVARVSAGTEVAFPNEDPSVHTVTIPALDVDELVRAEERTSITFDEPGTFDYVCTFHPPGMLGRLVVE